MAQSAYTYDPEKIGQGGKDQMRFELGDTMVEGGADTCALSDAEYTAIIKATPRWKKAKLRCIESILFRFSYEVDTRVGALSLSLSQRLEAWQKLRDDLKAEVETAAPIASPQAIGGAHYFQSGMMENRRAGGTEGGVGCVPPNR
jgi:hypothetical protein